MSVIQPVTRGNLEQRLRVQQSSTPLTYMTQLHSKAAFLNTHIADTEWRGRVQDTTGFTSLMAFLQEGQSKYYHD